jgi:PAS domain S-box-containing protein
MPDDTTQRQRISPPIVEKESAQENGNYTGMRADPSINTVDDSIDNETARKQEEAAGGQERELLMEQLQKENALLDALFSNAPVGIGFLDRDLRPLKVNKALAEMSGIPAEQRRGETLEELYPALDTEIFSRLHRVVATGEPLVGHEISGFTSAKPGVRRYWSVNYFPVYLHGEIVGVGVICTEITQRRLAEIEQEKARERGQFLSKVSKVLASSLDYQTTISNIADLVVPELADWFTVDLLDEQGNFHLLEVAHRDPAKVAWAWELRKKFPVDPEAAGGSQEVVRTGKAQLYPDIPDEMLVALTNSEEELEIARQVGFSSVIAVPLVARGKTLGVVTFIHAESGRRYDENDLALAEEVGRRAGVALDNARLYREIKDARDQLDVILQGVGDGIFVQDSAGRTIFANEATAIIFGYTSADEMLSTPIDVMVKQSEMIDDAGQPFPLDQFPNRRAFAGEREPQAIIGFRNRITGQPERWLLIKARSIYDEQGNILYVITLSHDITEQHLAEKRKDEFISMASHELKTPVTSIKGFTQVLLSRLKYSGDEQTQRFLARMDAQLNKLTKLINDLLDISKMQSGKLPLQKETFRLDLAVSEIVENLQAVTPTHQLWIEESVEVEVYADKDRIEQVLINLLTNAVKYSPDAKDVVIRVTKDEEQATVSVQDQGIGIDIIHQQKIFERFYQVTDPMEKTYPGLGIGLYISHEIMQRHHGSLKVVSSKGHSSTFSFSLPLNDV